MKQPAKKSYWYKIIINYCPDCGHEAVYKERQYSKKPKDRDKRVIMHEVWCGRGI